MKWKTKVTTKEGIVIKFPGKFRGYNLAIEEEIEENERLKEVWKQMKYVISDSNSDLESIASRLSPEPNPDIATITAQQLQNIIPQIITQVTTNVNNVNRGNGNGGNNGCSYKNFTTCNPNEFDGKGGAVELTRWIEKMESMFDNSVQERGREAAIGMSWNNFKALLVEEFCPRNELEKLENEFCNHTMSVILTAGILTDEAVHCGALTKGNDKRKEMDDQWKQATRKARKPLALEGNRNTQNNRNQARGREFVVEAIQDPKVMTEIADAESVEVDKVIHDCKLELGNSLFTIDLIPLGHGSFDVIVGMDWLSKNKAVIVCHEKVVEIPIKEGGILHVHGERTWRAAKALMNSKVDKPRISDIPM
nr:hypothetical protein [Tanacetum cinerariifolium]